MRYVINAIKKLVNPYNINPEKLIEKRSTNNKWDTTNAIINDITCLIIIFI